MPMDAPSAGDPTAADAIPKPGAEGVSPLAGIPHMAADAILAHPAFESAFTRLVDDSVALFGDDRRLMSVLLEFTRLIGFVSIIGLDAVYDAGDPSTYATIERLHGFLGTMGLTSRRRLVDFVTGLERDGFILREASPADRRTHILRPTEKMKAADREWIAKFHAPLAMVSDDPARYAPALARDPAYQRAFRRAALLVAEVTNGIMASEPGMAFFLSHKIGIRVLMVLMQAVRGRTPPRTDPGFYTAAAALTGASRVHVRNLMREAAALGLLDISALPDVRIEVREPFMRGFERWTAASMSGVDITCSLALRGAAPAHVRPEPAPAAWSDRSDAA